MSCRLLAEIISLALRRLKQRKYIPSGVTVVEIDKSSVELSHLPTRTSLIGPAPETRVITSMTELEEVFGSPRRLYEQERN